MVTIPTAADIGRVSARSGRIAPNGPLPIMGEAVADFGRSIVHAGYNLNDLRATEQQDSLRKHGNDVAVGVTKFLADEEQKFLAAQEQSSESGIGFTRQFMEGYQSRANEFAKANFEGLSDTDQAQYLNSILSRGNSLFAKANQFEGVTKAAYYDRTTNQGLDTYRTQIRSNASDFETLKAEGLKQIDSADMPEPWKAERRAAWASDAAESRWKWEFEQNPRAAIAAVSSAPLPGDIQGRAKVARDHFVKLGYTPEQAAGIVGNLVQESGVRSDGPSGDNGTAHGIAQWRGERLTRLQRFASATGRDWKDFTAQLDFIDMELKNHETDAYAALKRATTVDEATAAFIGYERPAGWSKNNPRGGHGWGNRLSAAQQVSGDSSPADYADIPFDRREQLAAWGETEANKQETEQRVASRVVIDTAMANAPAAIQNTGEYTGQLPTPEQFIAAYGEDAPLKSAQFQQAIETSQAAFKMQSMSAEDIAAIVAEARPTSSGDTAALDQARYETLSRAADATLKARNDDPALYVRRVFPAIDSAWSTVQAGENYTSAVAMSIAAQQQLGITDIKPLPKDAAEYSVERFKDANLPEAERFSALTSALMSTPDAEQRRAIFEQLVDAGLPEITEGAIEALSRGDTGAARRLFQAAVIDPSKLPGQSPEKPAAIDEAIQASLMDAGQVGDIYYGLSDGTAENFVRAERDSKLLSNAVNLRLRNGESLDDAVNSAAKDLYGDVQVVDRAGNLNAQVLIPAGQDAEAVSAGLAALAPRVKEAITSAMPKTSAAPRGKPSGLIESGNIDLAARPQVKNADGSISTVRSMSFNADGVEVLIPTVSPDGKILSDEDAIALYARTGKHLGKFKSPKDADAYAGALHDAQDRFYSQQKDGTKAILDAATSNYINNVLAEGFFRNSGDGFVFIDPYVGAAVSDEKGNPIVFTIEDVMAAKPKRDARTPSGPLTDDAFDRFQERMGAQ